jgi:hypothetical protein
MMRFYEFVSNGVKPFIGSVRAVVQGMGSVNGKVKIEADSLMSARYALSRIYGKENVLSVQQPVSEDGGISKPLTPDQLQVKALNDKSAQLKTQAKRIKAQQKVQKAQANLAKVNSSAMKSSLS